MSLKVGDFVSIAKDFYGRVLKIDNRNTRSSIPSALMRWHVKEHVLGQRYPNGCYTAWQTKDWMELNKSFIEQKKVKV